MMQENQYAIRNGLIWAGIHILVNLAFYIFDNPVSMWQSSLVLIAGLYLMTQSGLRKRKENGGYISWKQALTPIWVTAIVYSVISILYNYIFMNFIDPELVNKIKQVAIDMLNSYAGVMTEDQLEKEIEKIESEDYLSFSKNLSFLMASLIIYFIVAAIISLFVRKNNPNEFFRKYGQTGEQENIPQP